MEQKEFETEIRRIRDRLRQEAMRYLRSGDDAEDVTQEVVLKLWSMRDRLDQYRSVEALALVMTRRLSQNRLRLRLVSLTDWRRADTAGDETPETRLISKEEEQTVIRLMKTLPDAQQTVLRMRHVDGMETAEIARLTGSSEEAVRANLSRARRKIMKMFM